MTPFAEYEARPEMNGSRLWHATKSMRQFKWVLDHGTHIPADVTRVGTALHSIVEFLPADRFDDYYVVQPDFHLSPNNLTLKGTATTSKNTQYVKDMVDDFRAQEVREVLTRAEYQRIVRMLRVMSEDSEVMELVKSSEREVAVFGEIDGVECKGLIDGIGLGVQWNLKTTNRIDQRSFCGLASRLGYLFKDALHRELMRQSGYTVSEFRYVVCLDSKPVEGRYREAADCVVVPVPSVILDNQMPLIYKAIRQYKDCLASGEWPGLPSYPFTVPSWDMSEEQFEDTLV